jgi:benzoylsuccinyl-CoA thiolase BbsB subunit
VANRRSVEVVATAIEPFSRRADVSVDVLGARAVRRLLAGSSFDAAPIDEAYVGTSKGGSLIGQRLLRYAGLAVGLPVFNVENACASSGVAFHLAHRAIDAGDIECALVVGVDQLSGLGKGPLPVQETEWWGDVGASNPALYAMRARRYMDETGATTDDLAEVVVKSREFASRNPAAHQRTRVTREEVLASPLVADPLTLFQCSPKSDGAAALLLMSSESARRFDRRGPRVRSSVMRSGRFEMGARDITRPDTTARATTAAYEAAGVGPDDLDVVELHDAFSIAELLYVEELGLCAPGGAVAALRDGRTRSLEDDGTAVVNPGGGLIGRGHPVGATGAAQLVECVAQLTGRAGDRQKAGAATALAHVTGGGASGFDSGACTVTILSAD